MENDICMFKDIIIVVLIITLIIVTFAYSCLARNMDDFQYIRLQYIINKEDELDKKMREVREKEKNLLDILTTTN